MSTPDTNRSRNTPSDGAPAILPEFRDFIAADTTRVGSAFPERIQSMLLYEPLREAGTEDWVGAEPDPAARNAEIL